MKRLLFLLVVNVMAINFAVSQSGVAINTTGAAADNSAMLDVSSSSKGLLIPRMATTERNGIATPATSLLIFNITTNCFESYVNNIWFEVSCPSSCTVPAAPTGEANTASQTSITWNWSTVSGATSYQWNTSSTYPGVGVNVIETTSFTQTGLTCNTSFTLYVWAYNSCGNSTVTILKQTTSACGPPCIWNNSTSFTDSRDNQTYKQVQIGKQCWMAQNLNYGTWTSSVNTPQSTGYKFCTNAKAQNDSTCPYGGLYEWANMMNGASSCNGTCTSSDGLCDGTGDQQSCATPIQGLCPNGWHIPSHYEWSQLEQAVCAQSPVGTNCATDFPYNSIQNEYSGTTEGAKLKSTTLWYSPNCCDAACDGGGTCNTSGFTAIQGGVSVYGALDDVAIQCFWWSTTEDSPLYAWHRGLIYNSAAVDRRINSTELGLNVRCVKY